MPYVLQEGSDSGDPPRPGRHRLTRRWFSWQWLPWYALALVLVVIFALMWMFRQNVPVLTSDSLADARTRWIAARISDYEMLVLMKASGLKPSEVRVTVRGGRAIELTLNGEPASSGAPSLYTVDGLFELLDRELELASRPVQPASESQQDRPIVRACFDSATGVPQHFLRVVPGTNRSTEWRVLKWRALPAAPATMPASSRPRPPGSD